MAVYVKTKEEIFVMRECGKRLAEILRKVASAAKPGMSAKELDELAEALILKAGGMPVFKGYKVKGVSAGFPGSICVSVNDEVVHGVPTREKILKEGDVVGIDIGMRYPAQSGGRAQRVEIRERNLRVGGHSAEHRKFQPPTSNLQRPLVTDMALTIGIGRISDEARRLIDATREALEIGIRIVKPGAHVGDIGYAVAAYLKNHHFGIVRDLAGHGVGYELHEDPLIPNYGTKGSGVELKEGMVIAIEPMAMCGAENLVLDRDGWTYRTADGSIAAHFEHSVAVTKDGAEALTLL